MPNYSVSIDRITVVGNLEITLQDLNYFLGQNWLFKNAGFEFIREDDDGNTEHLAWLEENKFKQNNWRLDFNPNHITEFEQSEIIRVVNKLDRPHFSRLDVAFDIFNDKSAMDYRVWRWNVTETIIETYKGRQKRVETIYWGARKSEQQIRLYDKYVEQTAKNKAIPEGIEQWARLELQLRGKKPTDWVAAAQKMLDEFKLPDLQKIENWKDRVALDGLIRGTVSWSELGSKTQAKYRKMINAGIGFDDSLAVKLVDVLSENSERLKKELQNILKNFGI